MKKLQVTISVRRLPYNYTCDGEDISPMIGIEGVDKETTCMALVMLDANSPGGGGLAHWLIWNIDPATMIPEAIKKEPVITFPFSAVQGTNDLGNIGYSGPCPPQAETHRYDIMVYGLDSLLDLGPGAKKVDLLKAMEGHIVQYGRTDVVYGR